MYRFVLLRVFFIPHNDLNNILVTRFMYASRCSHWIRLRKVYYICKLIIMFESRLQYLQCQAKGKQVQ